MTTHNPNEKKDKSMIWMMIPCFLMIAVILFGGSKLASSGYLWLIIVGVCMVPHLWMMFKGHGECGGHSASNTEDKIDLPADSSAKALSSVGASMQAGDESVKQHEAKDEDNKHKSGGCCH